MSHAAGATACIVLSCTVNAIVIQRVRRPAALHVWLCVPMVCCRPHSQLGARTPSKCSECGSCGWHAVASTQLGAGGAASCEVGGRLGKVLSAGATACTWGCVVDRQPPCLTSRCDGLRVAPPLPVGHSLLLHLLPVLTGGRTPRPCVGVCVARCVAKAVLPHSTCLARRSAYSKQASCPARGADGGGGSAACAPCS